MGLQPGSQLNSGGGKGLTFDLGGELGVGVGYQ